MTIVAVRGHLARTPHVWVYGVAATAAAILAMRHLSASPSHHHHMGGPHAAMHVPVPALMSTWWWWIVMAVAMMFPIAAPGARRIAQASMWRRRHVAMAEFLAGYLVVWAVVGLVALWAVSRLWHAGAPRQAVAIALLIAAVWQVMPVRRNILRRCRGSAFVNVRGWRADRDCVIEGINYGRRCVVTCGPVMAVMALGHSLILMACLTALLMTERARGPNPADRAGRPFEAVCLAALAGAVVLTG